MSDLYDGLSAAFSQTHKKNGMDYLTGEQVTSRLNEVLGFDGWSFSVVSHGYNEEADEYWTLGQLIVHASETPVVRQQFGSQKPNRYSGGANQGKIIDLGFDLKGATTDALKKCASLIGVGLYLHEKDSPGATQQASGPAASAAPNRSAPPAAAPPKAKKPTFEEMTAQMGFTKDEVDVVSQRHFGNRAASALTNAEKLQLLVHLENERKEKVA